MGVIQPFLNSTGRSIVAENLTKVKVAEGENFINYTVGINMVEDKSFQLLATSRGDTTFYNLLEMKPANNWDGSFGNYTGDLTIYRMNKQSASGRKLMTKTMADCKEWITTGVFYNSDSQAYIEGYWVYDWECMNSLVGESDGSESGGSSGGGGLDPTDSWNPDWDSADTDKYSNGELTDSGSGGSSGNTEPADDEKEIIAVSLEEAMAAQLELELEENPYLLVDIDCDQIEKWQDLAQHKPSQEIVDKISSLQEENNGPFGDWNIQKLEEAEGIIVNMDYWPVKVSRMPNKANGSPYSPAEFLELFRKNINDFVDKEPFEPYGEGFLGMEESETILWNSNDPVGAIIKIDIDPNDGVVICSEKQDDHWRFMTVEAPWDWSHPVSGTREFGYEMNADGTYTFYTRGVDRFTSGVQELAAFLLDKYGNNNNDPDPYAPADEFWQGLQAGIVNQVEAKGGSATSQDISKNRVIYDDIKEILEGTKPISELGCN